jgi:hypothetical protein
MRDFFEGLGRDHIAVNYVGAHAEAWIVGLALRSLGVTTVNGRASEELQNWPGRRVLAIAGDNDAPADLGPLAASQGPAP